MFFKRVLVLFCVLSSYSAYAFEKTNDFENLFSKSMILIIKSDFSIFKNKNTKQRQMLNQSLTKYSSCISYNTSQYLSYHDKQKIALDLKEIIDAESFSINELKKYLATGKIASIHKKYKELNDSLSLCAMESGLN